MILCRFIKFYDQFYYRNKNEIQQKVSAAFLQTFQLTTDELFALHGNKQNRDAPITADIFTALNRVQKIHDDCKILMQAGLQTLALDVMEQMTLHQVNIDFVFTFNSFLCDIFRKARWKDCTDGHNITVGM